MDLCIAGRVAVVTGASRGIGLAIARSLAAEGCKVVIVSRDESALNAARKVVGPAPETVLAVVADITREADRERLVATVRRKFGKIDILVNNAGAAFPSPLASVAPEDFQRNRVLNVDAALYLTRLVLPDMLRQRWGRIVNVAALSAKEPRPGQGTSNAWKAALVALSKTLAQEVAAEGVTVNCVLPGRIRTPQIERRYSPEDMERFAEAYIPVGRLGEPEEVAAVVTFLVSEPARYVTGIALPVDGGMSRAVF